MSGFEGFGAWAVDFYERFAADNTREWWSANKAIWESDIRDPMQQLAEELAPRFGEAKVFRPHRDLRFTPDKRPYKENASLVITSGNGGGGLYLEFSAEGLLLAGGYWQPARDQLERFRDLQDDPKATADLDRMLERLADAGFSLDDGAPVKTVPRGRARDHPRIELIRRTMLTVDQRHDVADWLYDERCLVEVTAGFGVVDGWNRWLDDHVGPCEQTSRAR